MLQEQTGLYGAIIIHKRDETRGNGQTALLSNGTDEKPYEVEPSLHYATDWYAIRKGSVQDYAQAIKERHFGTKLTNEWKRMLAMDVSDVAYDRFLVNGRPGQQETRYHAGDKVRLRIIN